MIHFNARKYCDRECMATAFRVRPKTFSTPGTGRHHARNLVPPGHCERCGKPKASDIHHRNGNPLDNSLKNLERICRSCHVKEHQPKGFCTICGEPQKGLGYCEKHYQRFKKWGDPLLTKRNQHSPLKRQP